MSATSYAVIGTGGVGGYYGGLLQRAGHVVDFLARSDADFIEKNGLRVESKFGDFHLPGVRAHRDAGALPPCDVVLVTLKTTQNQALAQLLPSILSTNRSKPPIIALLQNGLGIEATIAHLVPGCVIVGGLCFLCSNKVGPGHVRHLDYGLVTFAEHRANGAAAGVTDAVNRLAQDFEHAGVATRRAEDLVQARWQKLVWNVPFNGLSVALDAMTDELLRDEHARRLVKELMSEVVAGASAWGKTIDSTFVDRLIEDTERMRPYATSMKLDYDAHRPLEIEAIFAAPLRAASEKGRRLACMEMLTRQLQFLDSRNTRPSWQGR